MLRNINPARGSRLSIERSPRHFYHGFNGLGLELVLIFLTFWLGSVLVVKGQSASAGRKNECISVGAGHTHTVVLKSDGTVWGYGANANGQLGNNSTTNALVPVQANGLSGITAIAAGYNHTVALKSDGTVWDYGWNANGELGNNSTTDSDVSVQVSGFTGAIAVSAGYSHTLALKNDGTVWTWGNNSNGQLGNNSTTESHTPVQVSSLTGVIGIAGGRYHSVALKSDGTVWTWGYNSNGQLGNNSTTDSHVPVQVSGLSGIVAIAGGAESSVALKNDGTVWTWGAGSFGQLGTNSTADSHVPAQVSGLSGVESIASTYYDVVALKSDGTEWNWGDNAYGQLGNNSTTTSLVPVQVSGISGAIAVAVGRYDTITLKNDGTVTVAGLGDVGELGNNTTTNSNIPTASTISNAGSAIVNIFSGAYHGLTIENNGTLWAWGDNADGQLGDTTTTNRTSPVQVSGLSNVRTAAAGGYHSLAVKSNGTVWAWGDNEFGQLGDGTLTQRDAPVQVSSISGIVQVAAGLYYSLGLKSDGTVWAWGLNTVGELGNGTLTPSSTPVQVSGLSGVKAIATRGYHSLAIKSDGTLWAWGYNTSGQIGDGTTTTRTTPVQITGISAVMSLSAGGQHSAAITADGKVWTWGNNNYGQLGDGTTTNRSTPYQVQLSGSPLNNGVMVSLGNNFTEVLRADGTVVAFGENDQGELGDGTTTQRNSPEIIPGLSGIPAIAAGGGFMLTQTYSSGIEAWGDNTYGELGNNSPAITSAFTATGTASTSFSYTITATNSPTSYNAAGLPSGLSINTGTGVISGTPTAAGISNIMLSAANAAGTGIQALTLTVSPSAVGVWIGTDIGAVGFAGSDSYNGTTGVYTLTGSGADINGTADAFHFVYQPLAGDGSLSARMVSLQNTNATSKVGVMVRQSTDAGAITDFIAVTSTAGTKSYNRTSVNGGMNNNVLTASVTVPYWLKIAKVGTVVTVYQSPDGVTWTNEGQVTLSSLTNPVDIGFAVCSHDNTVLCTATVDNIVLVGGAVGAPVINSPSTATGATGSAFTYTITATNTPTSYNATGLPAGLSVNTTTGVISGTPTVTGTSTVSLTATNASGTGSASLGLTITIPAPVISDPFTSLISFAGTNGTEPYTGLILGTDGNFYGTTDSGGGNGYGTIFKITPSGSLTTLYSFSSTDGLGQKGLIQGSDGNFYGLTSNGGSSSDGTVFKLTPSGSMTILATFNGTNGSVPIPGLIQGSDGNFYGTTTAGGSYSDGTVFKMTPGGSLTTLYSFAGADGSSPSAALVQASDGNFYGTTSTGGSSSDGTVFRMTPSGSLTTLATFNGTNGKTPLGALIQGGDTNFYGTALFGGSQSDGTIFKMTPTGSLTTLWSFTGGDDGKFPYAGLTQGADGNFYGIARYGAINGYGAVFEVTPSGSLTTLYKFTGTTGSAPTSVVQGSDGNLYGTTANGGSNSDGTVFKVTPFFIKATAGNAFSYPITASNSPTSYNATGLPTGLSVNTSTGLISGTPTIIGTSTVTLSAANAGGVGTGSLTITVVPLAPVITSATTAAGTTGSAFSYTIIATNSPTSYNVVGVLPAGLSFSTSTGLISGTPTATGVYPLTVSATNAGGTGSQTMTLTVSAGVPVINSSSSASGNDGTAFTYTINASNTPTSYSATGLPAGLSINTTTGVITGTPTGTPGVATVTLKAINAGGTATQTFTLTIYSALPIISSTSTASGNVGSSFNYTITSTNAPPILSYGATGLPAGLTINTSSGAISGTPTDTGISTVTLNATNASGTGTAPLTLTINNPLPVIHSALSVTGTVSAAFSYQITSTATVQPITYNATALPGGLSVNTSSGIITGTPAATGTSNVTISVTSAGLTGSAMLVLKINSATAPVINSSTTATSTVGVAISPNYTITTAANNSTSFTATGLPTGLSLNTTSGVISGTPTVIGESFATLGATNSGGTGNATLDWVINPPAPVVTSATSAAGTAGIAISLYTIVGTNTPTRYGATNLPPGLNINASSGVVSGVPISAGTWTSVISAINAGGMGSANLTFTVGSVTPLVVVPISIAAGDIHTLLLHSDGTVWATGDNYYGQLGNGDLSSVSYVKVQGLPSGIVAIAAGYDYSMALASDGTVWTWGRGWDGELGNGLDTQTSIPVQVMTSAGVLLNGITSIAAGDSFAMALKKDGTVWTWGEDYDGSLGNGDNGLLNQAFAVQVSQSTGLTNVVAIAGGASHALAVKSDGTVWAWGSDEVDQLGIEETVIPGSGGEWSTLPVQVPGLSGIMSVAAGANSSFALKNDGTVWSWGDNSGGYLGNGFTGGNSEAPVAGMATGPARVSNLSGIIAVSSGRGDHALVLASNGTLWAWGANAYGQLGNGTTTSVNTPILVPKVTGVIALGVAGSQSSILKSDGSIWAWGYNNDDSDIGAGGSSSSETNIPTTIRTSTGNLTGITQIAAAKSHYLAIRGSDGTVWTWGDTTPGAVSDGVTIVGSPLAVQVTGLSGKIITAIACGTYENFALDNTNHVWAWGQNVDGVLGNGTFVDSQTPVEVQATSGGFLSGITSIAASTGRMGVALDSSHNVWTWGNDYDGELGSANGSYTNTNTAAPILTGVASISAAAQRVYAIKTDGSVWAWGGNFFGEIGYGSAEGSYSDTPTQVTVAGTVSAISGGYYDTFAFESTGMGTVLSWGNNQVGELGNGNLTSNSTPASVSSLTGIGITQVVLGEDSYHGLALKSGGTVWAWGSNSNGQLGQTSHPFGSVDGLSPTGSASPVQVQGLSGITLTALACGKFTTIGLTSTQTVLQWGDTSYEPIGFSVPIQINDPQVTVPPTISPAGGSFSSSQSVTITTALPGTIHYTVDGTVPTIASPAYTGSAFTVSASARVNAVVINSSGLPDSPVGTVQFYINDPALTGLGPAPTVPTTTTPSATEIDLSWSVTGMQTYSQIYVYRSVNGGAYSLLTILGPTVTGFADTSVNSSNSYSYEVGTYNQSGVSFLTSGGVPQGSASLTPADPSSTLTIQITAPTGATPLP